MMKSLLWRVLLGSILILPVRVAGQEPEVSFVRDLLIDRDGDYVPDRLGDTVTAEGTLLSDPLVIGPAATITNFQDRTGGLLLFARDTSLFRSLSTGDSIRVRGVIAQYRGAEQIVVHGYEYLGHAAVPEPRNALVVDVLSERLTGRLVRVVGTMSTTTPDSGWIQATIEDRTGRVEVHISGAWLAHPEFVETLRRGGEVEVVAIAGQRTSAVPPADGYILYPRSTDDFSFTPAPPYEYLAAAVVLIMILGLILWRRATARRAHEFECLARELESSREELRIREERFRSLVENATDTVTILNPEGVFLYHSPSVSRMLGWDPHELEGRRCASYLHPEDRTRAREFLAAVISGSNPPHEVQLRFQNPDGEWRDLEVTATNRLDDPAVRGIVCNARDVTHHKALEHRLRQADRLEAVGRLAGGISHDFNNILTALRGHADMALEEIPEQAPGRGDVEEIARSADRAADVTRQLLAFTRQQVRESRVVSVSGVVDEMLEMLRRLIGENIRISTDMCAGGDYVEADPAQIEQVILNLVINARDAMPEGGRIVLAVATDEITESDAERYPYRVNPGAYVHISVADSGTGMSEEVLARVFEPFFTTKEPGKGTGLGLASVYGIVKQSSGYVWATSGAGEGSRFDIFLPQVERPSDEQLAEPPLRLHAPPADGEVILLVEDQDAVRRLAQRVLARHGYEVLDADGAEAALKAAHDNPHIDLVLTDVVMPGINGIRLAERLRELRPDLPVIFMSGYMAEDVLQGWDGSEAVLLEKPFTPNQLLEKVGARLQEIRAEVVG